MQMHHWMMVGVVLVVGYVLGRKFPQLGMGFV